MSFLMKSPVYYLESCPPSPAEDPKEQFAEMKRRLVCSLVTSMVTAASLLCAGLAQGSERPKQTTVRVIHEIKHDVSASLGELASMTPAQPLPLFPHLL